MDIEYNQRGLLSAIFRQQFKFLFFLIAAVLIGMIIINITQPQFRSAGSLLVKFGQNARPNVTMPDSGGPAEFSPGDRSEIVQSNITIMRSQNLLRQVIDEIGVDKIYPELKAKLADQSLATEVAISRLLKNDLHVNAGSNSTIIEVSTFNADPKIAAQFTNTLMERFITRQTEVYNAPQTNFLQQQVTEAKARLDKSQAEFQKFKLDVGVTSIDAELEQLRGEKSEMVTITYEAVTQAQERLAAKESEAQQLKATYRADSPNVMRAEQSVAIARGEVQRLQHDLNAGQKGGTAMSTKMKDIAQRISYLETQRPKFNDLEEKVRLDGENYKYYLQRGEEARVDTMLNEQNITRISIIDKATVPSVPVRPQKALILALAIIAGLMIGLGISFVSELMDDRFTTPVQLSASLGLPVLASFPEIRRE